LQRDAASQICECTNPAETLNSAEVCEAPPTDSDGSDGDTDSGDSDTDTDSSDGDTDTDTDSSDGDTDTDTDSSDSDTDSATDADASDSDADSTPLTDSDSSKTPAKPASTPQPVICNWKMESSDTTCLNECPAKYYGDPTTKL
jgi:hypothetical protein